VCSAYSDGDFFKYWDSRGQYFNLTNAGTYIYDVRACLAAWLLGCLNECVWLA